MNDIGSGLPPSDWDEQVLALGGNFLQSRAWAQFQSALDRPVYFAAGDGWNWVGPLRRARGGFKYLAPAYGPTVALASALAPSADSLRTAGQQLGVDLVRIEPVGPVTAADLQAAGAVEFAEVQPTHTNVLDLTPELDQLKSGLESGHRSRINGAERRGIVVRQTDDAAEVDVFLAMLHDTARHNKIRAFDDEYYRTMYRILHEQNAAQLYIAEAAGEPVAAAISFDWGPTRYYAHAAAYQARNRQVGASVVLVWQMIVDAKQMGKTQFDFWGVAPAGAANHKWAGLSAFKRAFGGTDRDYVGTWDLPIRSGRYKLYRQLKRVL